MLPRLHEPPRAFLRPLLHRVYPFADVRAAFEELEKGRARGKIVVSMPSP